MTKWKQAEGKDQAGTEIMQEGCTAAYQEKHPGKYQGLGRRVARIICDGIYMQGKSAGFADGSCRVRVRDREEGRMPLSSSQSWLGVWTSWHGHQHR